MNSAARCNFLVISNQKQNKNQTKTQKRKWYFYICSSHRTKMGDLDRRKNKLQVKAATLQISHVVFTQGNVFLLPKACAVDTQLRHCKISYFKSTYAASCPCWVLVSIAGCLELEFSVCSAIIVFIAIHGHLFFPGKCSVIDSSVIEPFSHTREFSYQKPVV